MKSFLVHIASFAVMFHMTFGCNWHHGFGTAQECVNRCGSSVCCEDGQDESTDCCDSHLHAGHGHDLKLSVARFPRLDVHAKSDHGGGHLGCQNDGCSIAKAAKFVFEPLDFLTDYLGGAENSALAASATCQDLFRTPLPDYSHTATSMRPNLQLGVLLI